MEIVFENGGRRSARELDPRKARGVHKQELICRSETVYSVNVLVKRGFLNEVGCGRQLVAHQKSVEIRAKCSVG